MQVHGCGLPRFPPVGREGHPRVRGKSAQSQATVTNQGTRSFAGGRGHSELICMSATTGWESTRRNIVLETFIDISHSTLPTQQKDQIGLGLHSQPGRYPFQRHFHLRPKALRALRDQAMEATPTIPITCPLCWPVAQAEPWPPGGICPTPRIPHFVISMSQC